MRYYRQEKNKENSHIMKKINLFKSDSIDVYCTIKIPPIAEGNPKSCMRIFPIIADAFGISLRPQ